MGQESVGRTETMSNERFQKGLEIRKAVLGADHVTRSLAAADEFTKPLQELVTEYCWGEVWGSDALPRKTRSLLNIAALTALNRPHEIELHVRGAVKNGCTMEEIRAVLLQMAIYCGVPAALDATKIARGVLCDMGVLAERS
jgi:4-carboxymuconolactone decarboxylase